MNTTKIYHPKDSSTERHGRSKKSSFAGAVGGLTVERFLYQALIVLFNF
jgi:hypothetical protein